MMYSVMEKVFFGLMLLPIAGVAFRKLAGYSEGIFASARLLLYGGLGLFIWWSSKLKGLQVSLDEILPLLTFCVTAIEFWKAACDLAIILKK